MAVHYLEIDVGKGKTEGGEKWAHSGRKIFMD